MSEDKPVAQNTMDSDSKKSSKTAKAKTAKQRRWPGWLALIISLAAIALAGASAWWQWQARLQDNTLKQDTSAQLQSLQQNVQSQIQNQIQSQQRDQQQNQQKLGAQNQLFAQQLAAIAKQSANNLRRINNVDNAERDDWKLAEADYLLRLAHQRLLLGGEFKSALALLVSADRILYELDYADLFPVREELANNIAAVRAAAVLDTEGTFLRLSALASQTDQLVLVGPETLLIETPTSNPAIEGSWQNRLQAGWEKIKQLLSKLLVIKARKVDVEPLLSSDQRLHLRARLQLRFEQAKTALLLKQAPVYKLSLTESRQLIERYFELDDQATVAALKELDSLLLLDIDPELPNISRAQGSLHEYIQNRHQRLTPEPQP
ncbi:MAG: uroporphyrinogen-III C-methyltransferase [Pseudomonadales bacterium]